MSGDLPYIPFILQNVILPMSHKIICKKRKFTVKTNEKIYGYDF